MKRFALLAVLAVVGCRSARVEERPLPDGYVRLATFTVEVDANAGTVTVRQEPTEAGSAAGMTRITNVDSNVTVRNTPGSYWYGVTHAGCTGYSGDTWGANVQVTSNLSSSGTRTIRGVYAEVTDYAGVVAGTESCNKVVDVPAGMNGNYGLWSYGALTNGSAVAQDWIFKYVSATNFTFHGQIVGAYVDDFTSPPNSRNGPIAPNGPGEMVYGDSSSRKLVIVDAAGAKLHESVPTSNSTFLALSTDFARGRIWFTGSAESYVGFTDGNGGNLVEAKSLGPNANLLGIAADPDGTGAWVISGQQNKLVKLDTSLAVSTVTLLTQSPYALAFGPNGNIYVLLANAVEVYDTAGALVGASTPVTGCPLPDHMIAGPSGKMYFLSSPTLAGAAVCTVSTSGTIFTVASVQGVANAEYLCVGPGEEVWALARSTNRAFRLGASSTGGWSVGVANAPSFCAGGLGAGSVVDSIWITNNVDNVLTRLQP